ncbi:MAG: 50S ribosomal protein L1 [Proteobacteria bacterium]|nr:50S ribosomal protein L1 [Pseudomonadota bacterium]
MAKVTKKRQVVMAKVDRTKLYPLTEAVQVLKECATAKFDEAVDVAVNLGVDPRHADQLVRGTVALPHGTGKKLRVAVFAKGDAAEAAKKAGAEVVGADDLAEKVLKGFMDFDRVVSTPDCMPVVGKLGKVLGPKGLMPNPKLGSVTPDVAKAVKEIKAGLVEFRVEKNGIVHAMVGRASFDATKMEDNIRAFMAAINAAKPSGAKGQYIKAMAISSTMGPGFKIDPSSLSA